MSIDAPKEKIIPIRFEKKDWEDIKKIAKKNFLDASTWIRQVVLKALNQKGKT